MKFTKIIMGMPVTVEIVDKADKNIFNLVFSYFRSVDRKFSTYKKNSEINKINNFKLQIKEASSAMKLIFRLSQKTKKETHGYFDIFHNKKFDPSGIVKGWAIYQAAKILKSKGFKNFYIEAGGDIQVFGKNSYGKKWKIGIKNPFNQKEIIKVVALTNKGIATSGTYIRGDHIYDPVGQIRLNNIVSISVIGKNIYDADRFATAAFAMGEKGINFLENLKGLEGYMINKNGIATMTSGFKRYIAID